MTHLQNLPALNKTHSNVTSRPLIFKITYPPIIELSSCQFIPPVSLFLSHLSPISNPFPSLINLSGQTFPSLVVIPSV